MKKANFVLLAFICLFGFNCQTVQQKKNNKDVVKTDGLKGRIKSISSSTYLLNVNTPTLQKDKLLSRSIFSYDSLGHRIKTVLYNELDSITSQSVAHLEYDKNGHILSEKDYGKDGLLYYIKFNYNDKGQTISEAWYRADSTLNFTMKYVYDKNDNKVEETKIDVDGSVILKYASTYDDDKNVVNRKNYDYNGELQFSDGFKYDKSGNQTELAHFDKDGNPTLKNVTTYDEKGNVRRIEKHETNIGTVQIQEFKYDNYDKKQNPLTAVVFINGKPAGISESVIQYY